MTDSGSPQVHRAGITSSANALGHCDVRHQQEHREDGGDPEGILDGCASVGRNCRCTAYGVCCAKPTAEDLRCDGCREWCP